MYANAAQSAKDKYHIVVVPLTTRGVGDFLRLAVTRTPPFQISGDKVTGFQDALILLSVVDDSKAHGGAACAVLSEDKIFSQISAVSGAGGQTVKHLQSIDDFWKILADEIAPQVVTWFREQREAVEAELEVEKQQISQLLRTYVLPDLVDYRARVIESIGLPRSFIVEMGFPPFPREPGPYVTREGARFKISVSFSTEIRARAVMGLSGLAASLIHGMRPGPEPKADEAEQLSVESFWKQVQMEGIATFERGRYILSDLSIVGIT